jgi:hypothetical protein
MTSLVAIIFAANAIAGYNVTCNKWHPTLDKYQPGFTVDDTLWSSVPWVEDHELTQDQTEFFAVRSVQTWARYGNTHQMPWIVGTAATHHGPWPGDGVNAITHKPCEPWDGCDIATPNSRGWTVAFTTCGLKWVGPPNPEPWGFFHSDCDITFFEDTPNTQDGDGLITWETDDIQANGRTGGPTGWSADFHRVLTHEMGHTFGLDHPDVPTDFNVCSLPADLDKCNADADSDDGPIMCAFANRVQTDVPTADDQNGLASLYGSLPGIVQFRYLLANGSSSNELYWDSYYNQPGYAETLTEPRISCTTDSYYGPDCTVANTTTDGSNHVQLNTFYGSSSLHRITTRQYVTTMNNSSIRAVDIAYRHRYGGNEAVAAYRDSANSNVVWLARWRPMDGSIFQFNTGVITQVEPRIAYNEHELRYYAVVVDRQRRMHLFVSANEATSWMHFTLSDSAGTADGLGRTFMPVGLVCDSHSNAVPLKGTVLPVCRLIYSPYALADQYKSGRFRQCEIRKFDFMPIYRLSSCIDTDLFGAEIVDVADYGESVPSGWIAGPQWLLSYSVPTVNSDNNTGAIFMDNDSQFNLPIVDGESGDHPRGCYGNHMYGGWSMDWCEYLGRFVAVEKWGCP